MSVSVLCLFIGVVIVAMTLFYFLKHAATRDSNIKSAKIMIMCAAWLILAIILGMSGLLADFSTLPPKMTMMLALVIVTSVLFSRSQTGRALADHTPLCALVGFQGFRILAELELFFGYQEATFPVQMTFEGYNFDILTAVAALILNPILRKSGSRALAWGFNILGIALLTAILVIAVLSMQTPMRQFMNDPANTAVASFPHILLPASLVQAAIVGHLLLTRRLRST
jgi:hypothetical protein